MIVSLIGTLEQLNLSNILQRIEAYAKTGLLVIKQDKKWVELSFRQGQLMCIGPVRPDSTLGERLLQAGIISQQAFQEALYALGSSQHSETRTVITLIDFGYLNQESLYTWAAKEASRVLQVLLTWPTGEISFEEGLQPPEDRLLVAFSVTKLLSQQSIASTPQPVGAGVSSAVVQAPPAPGAASPSIHDIPTLHDHSRFSDDAPALSPLSPASFSSQIPAPVLRRNSDTLSPSATRQAPEPVAPMRIDTSFMQPGMVLVPADLSAIREQNPQVRLTPEQWRLFTQADGQTTLQMACQALVMPPELVRQVAGELIVLGLVTLSLPGSTHEPASGSQDAAVGNSYVVAMPGYTTTPVPAWTAAIPAPGNVANFTSPAPVETHSQWGNGGNGATFVLGGGWVVASSQSQSSGPLNKIYAQAGSRIA